MKTNCVMADNVNGLIVATPSRVLKQIRAQIKKISAKLKEMLKRLEPSQPKGQADLYFPESFFRYPYCGRSYI
jgi:hypothetical protein